MASLLLSQSESCECTRACGTVFFFGFSACAQMYFVTVEISKHQLATLFQWSFSQTQHAAVSVRPKITITHTEASASLPHRFRNVAKRVQAAHWTSVRSRRAAFDSRRWSTRGPSLSGWPGYARAHIHEPTADFEAAYAKWRVRSPREKKAVNGIVYRGRKLTITMRAHTESESGACIH